MGIVTFMMTALVPLTWNVIGGSAKVAVEGEVYSQGRFAAERMKREIRNTTNITSVSSSTLVTYLGSSWNTTTFDVSGGKLRMTKIDPETGDPVVTNLNSDGTTVSGLTFTNYSSAPLKTKHVGFQFTISGSQTSGRQEYQESITIESSSEIRSF